MEYDKKNKGFICAIFPLYRGITLQSMPGRSGQDEQSVGVNHSLYQSRTIFTFFPISHQVTLLFPCQFVKTSSVGDRFLINTSVNTSTTNLQQKMLALFNTSL